MSLWRFLLSWSGCICGNSDSCDICDSCTICGSCIRGRRVGRVCRSCNTRGCCATTCTCSGSSGCSSEECEVLGFLGVRFGILFIGCCTFERARFLFCLFGGLPRGRRTGDKSTVFLVVCCSGRWNTLDGVFLCPAAPLYVTTSISSSSVTFQIDKVFRNEFLKIFPILYLSYGVRFI